MAVPNYLLGFSHQFNKKDEQIIKKKGLVPIGKILKE